MSDDFSGLNQQNWKFAQSMNSKKTSLTAETFKNRKPTHTQWDGTFVSFTITQQQHLGTLLTIHKERDGFPDRFGYVIVGSLAREQ